MREADVDKSGTVTASRRAAILILPVMFVLVGCAGLRPQAGSTARPALPATFDGMDAIETNAPALVRWWSQLRDEQLNALVDRAIASNRDVRTAVARIEESRARATLAGAASLLNVSAGGYLMRVNESDNGRLGVVEPDPVTERRLGFDASWELDLFGANARRKDAAQAAVEAAVARQGAVSISVAGEVVASYVELRAAQAQQAALRDLLASAHEIESLVRAREEAGLATELDRLRAEEQLNVTESVMPPALEREQNAARRLGVLVGGDSQSLLAELREAKPLPLDVPDVPALVPAALLDRRPDLVAAEAQWRASLALVAATRADRYPRFSLGGALGWLSISSGNIFDAASVASTLSGALRAPLYDPSLSAAVAVERARAEQAAIAYEQAAMEAILDVEQAATRLLRAKEREAQLAAALASVDESLELAKIRYDRGLIDFLYVLDIVRSQLDIKRQWIDARADTLTHFVTLNKTLGGGWESAAGF